MGIEKIEKEEEQLADSCNFWRKAVIQRRKKGKWK